MASNGANSFEPMGMVTAQPGQPNNAIPNPLAAPLLHSGKPVAAPGASLRVVQGGKGHLLSVRAVAGRLCVSTATVYKLVARGDLSHVRVSNAIRITQAALDAFLQAG
jgi:excisionase family DNA binding protein